MMCTSIRDLLLLLTTFSLLSLFTYNIGFRQRDDHFIVTSFPGNQLRAILRKLEREHMDAFGERWKVAKVQGLLSTLKRDIPLYARALRTFGILVLSQLSYKKENGNLSNLEKASDEWCLLLCLATLQEDDDYCFTSPSNISRKISRVPMLRSSLWQRNGLCRTRTLLNSSLRQFNCYPLPQSFEEFLTAADGPLFNKTWLLKRVSGRLEHLTTMEFFSRVRSKEITSSLEGLVEEFMHDQLRIFGHPISVQLYVLVTSMDPLRLYIFNEGIVNFRQEKERGFRKIKTWLLSQLWRHLEDGDAVRGAVTATDQLITQIFLASQMRAKSGENVFNSRCSNCFQLLLVELIYDSSLHPQVVEVDGLPSMQGISEEWLPSDRALVALRQAVLLEMLKIVFASEAVHEDVLHSLQSINDEFNIGYEGLNCAPSHALCLTEEDLLAILWTRRESKRSSDFRRVYPTANDEKYSSFIDNLYSISSDVYSEEARRVSSDMRTLFSRLEKKFSTQEEPDYPFGMKNKLSTASFHHQNNQLRASSAETGPNAIQQKSICSSDENAAAALQELELEPSSFRLYPPFTPYWTEYSTTVPYHLTLIRVRASSMRCDLFIRFEDRLGLTMSINTTLGLGLNRIFMYLVDTNGNVLTTYMLVIRRKDSSEGTPYFNPFQLHSVCSLTQECDFRISPTEPCGLKEEGRGVLAWNATLRTIKALPPCPQGDAHGRWLVPCASCTSRDTCVWKLAKWQPYACTHRYVSKEELERCLDGKKLLFLGDSTNRGMMHYIMQRLNGSLSACDKTHYFRVYDDLNKGRTLFSFAYYPQFWLSERPPFHEALYQLLLKSRPLQNTSSTVVIVGGVHWLGTHHLHSLLEAMQREYLQGANLVVKTLGSGFHTPVEGVHHLPKAQQEKLLMHSMGLAAFARHHRMEVVDTFNMTAARYKDFLQGKCACHFHKIVEKTAADGLQYRVEGPINAIYSEILLSRLCTRTWTPL